MCLLLALLLTPDALTGQLKAVVSQATRELACGQVLELSFQELATAGNPFLDESLDVDFTAPDGTARRATGFFVSGGLWKARLRPDVPGHWTYTHTHTHTHTSRYTYSAIDGTTSPVQAAGSFDCTAAADPGPVVSNPTNPFRWVFADGTPYLPIGLQDCVPGNDAVHLPIRFEVDGQNRSPDTARSLSPDDYFALYGEAGFNLFRFSQRNCSYPLFDNLDSYRPAEADATDDLLTSARAHGFRVMFGFFGASDPGTGDLSQLVKQQRFVDYCIARWGVYADFWELLNEVHASDTWTTAMADHIHAVDPYHHPVSTSFERPDLPAIDVNAPHWYESEDELLSDLRVRDKASQWKRAGKPVLVGEQGNTGMNWDPRSAVRMRLRAWTAVFQEVAFIFWNTSWAKDGMFGGRYASDQAANIYLGPEERGYTRVLRQFASHLDADIRMAPVVTSQPEQQLRAYGLRSSSVDAVYLHHADDHGTLLAGANVAVDVPSDPMSTTPSVAEWIDPATGDVINRLDVWPGRQTLEVPPFAVDLALLVVAPRT